MERGGKVRGREEKSEGERGGRARGERRESE